MSEDHVQLVFSSLNFDSCYSTTGEEQKLWEQSKIMRVHQGFFYSYAKLGSANCDRDSGPCGILAFLVQSLGLSNLPLDEDSNTVISLVV